MPPVPLRRALAALRCVSRDGPFAAGAFSTFCHGACNGATFALVPLVLKEVHAYDEEQVGRVFLAGGLITVGVHATATPWISARCPGRGAQGLALAVAACSAALAATAQRSGAATTVLAVAIFCFNSCCLGVCNTIVVRACRLVAPEALGAATGLTRSIYTLGFAFFPAPAIGLAMSSAASLAGPPR